MDKKILDFMPMSFVEEQLAFDDIDITEEELTQLISELILEKVSRTPEELERKKRDVLKRKKETAKKKGISVAKLDKINRKKNKIYMKKNKLKIDHAKQKRERSSKALKAMRIAQKRQDKFMAKLKNRQQAEEE